uniref:NADH dehydrogenase subunit 2 n=1 Tax=Balta jinlinorum TaxID=1928763 RepID=UPI00279DE525|nr:NADH dehydrogenase subunit 2 [Balta jinlinorum]WGO57093.1 NADH dehydrogenase subunit 2 [Balta jinlinorum]
MLNNSTKVMFYMTLVGGILLTTSSNSWVGAWMGLEINLLSFIPIMVNNENMFTTEASMKYFLVQVLASSLLLFVIVTLTVMEKSQLISKLFNHSNLMMIPLLLKSGAAPLHWWFPSVMEGMSWMNCLILMTLQKAAPMILMSNMIMPSFQLMTIVLMSVIIGSVGGLNQISLRKMLTYSSINHMGWLLAALLISNNLWMIYFMMYIIMTSTIILMIELNKISFINQTFTMNHNSVFKFLMFITLLSLGGLPPFMGFFPKWIVIQHMINNDYIIIPVAMIVFSLITLFYYLRITYSAFLMTHIKISWNLKMIDKIKPLNTTLIFLTIMGLIMLPLPFSIYL